MISTLENIRTKMVRRAMPILFRAETSRSDLVRIGSAYGGWWIPADLINSESICYAGGVGTDISFDLGLINKFGCRVWGIDPTPRTIQWIDEQELDDRFQLLPVGLGGEAGHLKFYEPEDPDHISHSVKNLQRTTEYFTAQVQTIADTMKQLGHGRVDLLKLDIEGAEHDAIRRMLEDRIYPSVLCVEYDQPEPLSWARATTKALRQHGYLLAKIEGLNLTFVRE